MKIKAKKIEWERPKKETTYPLYMGYINKTCIGYIAEWNKGIFSIMLLVTGVKLLYEDNLIPTLSQAKQKAQEILDKFVNDIAECEN